MDPEAQSDPFEPKNRAPNWVEPEKTGRVRGFTVDININSTSELILPHCEGGTGMNGNILNCMNAKHFTQVEPILPAPEFYCGNFSTFDVLCQNDFVNQCQQLLFVCNLWED